MSYTYGMKGAPAVGGGLGGLPRRSIAVSDVSDVGDVATAQTAISSKWMPVKATVLSAEQYPELFSAFGDSPANYLSAGSSTTFPVGTNTGSGAAMRGNYVALCYAGSTTYLRVYKRTGDTWNLLGSSSSSYFYGADFSKDGSILACAGSSSPYLFLFSASDAGLSALTGPSTNPTGAAFAARFSPDDTHLVVCHNTTPFVSIYSRNNTFFTKLANPASLPSAATYSAAYSPDGSHLALATSASPYITIYERNGDVYTKLAPPATLPTGTAQNVAYSPDGNLLVVAHATSPYLTIYRREGNTYTKLPDPTSLPAGLCGGCSFNHDGTLLSLVSQAVPYIVTYQVNGETFTRLSDLSGGGSGSQFIEYSPDSNYLVSGYSASPYMRVHRRPFDPTIRFSLPDITYPLSRGFAGMSSGLPSGTKVFMKVTP